MKPSTQIAPSRTPDTRRAPVEVLRRIFVERKEKNPHYSLNAFARDIGLTSSLLSRIFNGTRALSLKQGLHVAAVLGFSQAETNLFVLSIVENASAKAKISQSVRERIRKQVDLTGATAREVDAPLYVNYDVERFKTISQWYHLAILNLSITDGFDPDPAEIATRLNISTAEVREAVERLLELGLLERTPEGSVRKTRLNLYFKTQRSETAIRNFHSQMIGKAAEQLRKTETADFERRLINCITFVSSDAHLELLKKKINEFQDEVLAMEKPGPNTEVYQLNCQLFPLTQKESV